MRLPDWEERLSDYIRANMDRPFEYGQHDCILFSCGAVEAVTGQDPASEDRGAYADVEGAKETLKGWPGKTLLKAVDSVFERKPVGLAQRGDLVWFKGSVGVCYGSIAMFVGEERIADVAGVRMREGLISIPRGQWEKAWAV